MSNMFGTPAEHEESVRVRVAQRDGGLQPLEDNTSQNTNNENEPVVPEVDKPMVITPDGKMVEADKFDAFAQERQRLGQEEERLLNLRDTIVAETGGALATNTGDGNEGDQDDENAITIPRIEMPDDNEYIDDTQKAIVEGFNNFAAAFEQSAKQSQENIAAVTQQVTELDQETKNRQLEADLVAVEAHYGVERTELFAAARATGLTHPETLAKIVMGEKAQTARVEEAHAAAEAERREAAGGIGGGTRSPYGGNPQPTGRKEVDWNDKEAVVKEYNLVTRTPQGLL